SDTPALTGLAKQLVMQQLLDERTALQALQQAQRNQLPLVTYLVQNKLVTARTLAELLCERFGIAMLDLSSIDKDSQPRDLLSEKLARQHRVLPLYKRGTKLFIALSDPANHQAVTDV